MATTTSASPVPKPEMVEDAASFGWSFVAAAKPCPLTDREKEVLLLICEGMSSKEIATRLFISPKTVEYHRAHISDALGIRTTARLVRYAVRTGLIEP